MQTCRVNTTGLKLNCCSFLRGPPGNPSVSLWEPSLAWDTALWMPYNGLLTLTWTCNHTHNHFNEYFFIGTVQQACSSGKGPTSLACHKSGFGRMHCTPTMQSKDYRRQQHHESNSRPPGWKRTLLCASSVFSHELRSERDIGHLLQNQLRKRAKDTASWRAPAPVEEVPQLLSLWKIKARCVLTLRFCCDFTKMNYTLAAVSVNP